jgi:hypothetical protein
VLPSPIVYFYYKDTHSVTGTRWTNASTAVESDEGFQDNPLAEPGQSDVYDVEGSELPNVPPARAKLAKMQREAKDTRAKNQQMQTQLLQLQNENTSLKMIATTKDESTKVQALQAQNEKLQTEALTKDNEIASLKAITTAKDESTKVQALQAQNATLQAQLAQGPQVGGAQLQLSPLSDVSPGANGPLQQAAAKTVAIKEFAADEGLSEETRGSAQQALDDMAAAQIMLSTLQSKNDVEVAAAQVRQSKKMVLPGEEMAKYLESLRLLHYADAVIRVAGMCVDRWHPYELCDPRPSCHCFARMKVIS